ncbi:MAG TPA: prolyl oligopeptidase family serine peptidase [Anaerolineae bacterium]|nr:prolyl oligopeptidase family serine peptidase [Anaerolineae bacterium]HQI83665.1 prolyl oligopeptidase family serine peptidase [Anaerolineae bacterium]
MPSSFRIESLLAARLFMSPQLVGDRIFFLSNLSGRISLYAMDKTGSVPEPLLPPNFALQNPTLLEGSYPYRVFPTLGKIIVMIDQDGDENYQPHVIPLDGGIPEPLFGERFAGKQLLMSYMDATHVAFQVDHRTAPEMDTYLVDVATASMTHLGSSLYANFFSATNADYSKIILQDGYSAGDSVLYLWEKETGVRRLLYGIPIEARQEGQVVPSNGIGQCWITPGDRGVVFVSALFDDRLSLCYMTLSAPDQVRPVEVVGLVHEGNGMLHGFERLTGDRYLLDYNIDGVSWVYEGVFDETALRFTVERVLVGQSPLHNGVLQALHYEEDSGDYVLSFSTATSPAQIYTIEGPERRITARTRERILGIPHAVLSPGEDASFVSHDGLRVSARLYLPAVALGYSGPRPVIFYIHGGPQSQERPDFTWFSMPLIQFFTLNGFAVFVPNARGSSGYGLDYMKRVDHDWGGQDRLDHVAAFAHLRADPRLDMTRAGVMGRSYGGYMTLMQVGKHPELWTAACDMFGPYNMFTFLDRLPETWKTAFYLVIGHPEKDRERLIEQSPSTHLHNLACPLLVIQGRNDPRVVAEESEGLVRTLKAQGKDVELIVMENEGHDVIKHENKVRIYNAITDFFKTHLQP